MDGIMTWIQFIDVIIVPVMGLNFFLQYLLYRMYMSLRDELEDFKLKIATDYVTTNNLSEFKKDIVNRLDRIESLIIYQKRHGEG